MIHQCLSDILNLKSLPLGELGFFYGGLSGKSKEDFEDGNGRFVPYMNVFSNFSVDLKNLGEVNVEEGERQNKIEYGDVLFTGSSETPDECGMSSVMLDKVEDETPIYLNSFCFGFRFNDLSQIYPAFYKHLFRSNKIRKEIGKTANGVTRFNITKKLFAKILIPLPSLEQQKEIAGKLDIFTSIISKLDEEIGLRIKQFEYYRDEILRFDNDNEVVWSPLDEIKLSLKTGLNPRQNFKLNTEGATIPYVTGKEIFNNRINITDKTDKIDAKALALINRRACLEDNILLFASTGCSTVGRMAVVDKYNGDWAISETLYAIKFRKDINPIFIMHCLYADGMKKQYENKISRGSVPHLKVADLLKVQIPLCSPQKQEQVVAKLDAFTSLITNLQEERDLRQKQYEYYREKLLTFE